MGGVRGVSDQQVRRRYSVFEMLLSSLLAAAVATVVSLAAGGGTQAANAADESGYVPLTPARILDTRPAFQTSEFGSPWPAQFPRSVTVAGVDACPQERQQWCCTSRQ